MRPAIAHIHLNHLRHNYQVISSHSGHAQIMAVIKSNAYGHGLKCVAEELYTCGCRHFAVTDANEGKVLREILHQSEEPVSITLLSGLFGFDDAVLSEFNQLSPVVTEPHHIVWLHDAGFSGSVWLKIDTGMQRLGCSNLPALQDTCQRFHINTAGIMSHLACADTPEHPLNRSQADEFSHLRSALPISLPASLLNSAGLIALPDQTLDVVRPGLALYGAEPVMAEPLGLKPVMELTAQVMQIRRIEAGTPVSYGATFTADRDMDIALICAGYADGLPVRLSNNGVAEFNGEFLPIVGRICMDYCLLDCSNQPLKEGDSVSFWGTDKLRAEDVAEHLGVIPYTLMTGIPARVQRIPSNS